MITVVNISHGPNKLEWVISKRKKNLHSAHRGPQPIHLVTFGTKVLQTASIYRPAQSDQLHCVILYRTSYIGHSVKYLVIVSVSKKCKLHEIVKHNWHYLPVIPHCSASVFLILLLILGSHCACWLKSGSPGEAGWCYHRYVTALKAEVESAGPRHVFNAVSNLAADWSFILHTLISNSKFHCWHCPLTLIIDITLFFIPPRFSFS